MADRENVSAASGRKPFVKPELRVLDVKGTETGPFPDPSEFPTILQMS
ncbi:hypothetical protein [Erythrobacter sp. JK5]|nr:hypothetical protein [Erythrobacter sp. JK5]QUL37816.1 hypothetical protein KDC96_16055 [Erythrobacter sp. JK5]